jgi:hypothetical protein
MPTRPVYKPGNYETVEGERRWVPGRLDRGPDGATMLKNGVSAIVSRLTYAEVREWMARVATDDDTYRRQLEELAEVRGGIYADALVLLGDRLDDREPGYGVASIPDRAETGVRSARSRARRSSRQARLRRR